MCMIVIQSKCYTNMYEVNISRYYIYVYMLIIIVPPPLQYAFILSPCTCYYIVMYVVILCSFAMFYILYCVQHESIPLYIGPIILECVLLHKTVVESRVYTYVHTNGTMSVYVHTRTRTLYKSHVPWPCVVTMITMPSLPVFLP